MFVYSKIQGIAKAFWRLIELYLFCLASVFGGHIVAKNILSQSSKSKEKTAEYRVCHSTRLHQVDLTFLQIENASVKSASYLFAELNPKYGIRLSQSPFLSPMRFYHSSVVTDEQCSQENTNVPQHPHPLQPPLLI